jgi:very-short-patch-repair endonuclease
MPTSSHDERTALFDPRDIASRGLITTGFQLPYNPKLIEHARELRKNMTPAEKTLWYHCLRNFPYRVLRQRPIDHYIVDFYCPALRLVIEIDGESHFTNDGKESDEQRTETLTAYGLKVVRFTNREVTTDVRAVCESLHEMIPPEPAL